MRTCTFQSVLHGTARLLGIDPGTQALTSAMAAQITEFINRRVAEGWTWDFWPEWTVTEQRRYRPVWDAATTYTAGTELDHIRSSRYVQAIQGSTGEEPYDGSNVLNAAYWAECATDYSATDWTAGTVYAVGAQLRNPSDGLYYQCHTAHTAGTTFDASKFGVLTAFDKYVSYTQAGRTVIHEVQLASKRSPRTHPTKPWPVNFSLSTNGVQFGPDAPDEVWITFRLAPPQFTHTPYSAGSTYALGDLVYLAATGECYRSLAAANTGNTPSSSSAWWVKVDFPEILADWTKQAAYSDLLRERKNTLRAQMELNEAKATLMDTLDQVLDAQGQYSTASVHTYGT
jgi:hypothetical protein